MSIQSVTTQEFSSGHDQEQLNTLKASLEDLSSRYKNKSMNVPRELIDLGLVHQGDLAILYQDIAFQMYKFHHTLPGEMIKLSSMVAKTFGVSVYATRDSKGNFQIILDKNANRVQIQTMPLQTWQPKQSLFDRMEYLVKNPPAHLHPYFNEDGLSYSKAIQHHQDAIQKLYIGDSLEIEPDSFPGQKYPLRITKTTSSEYEVLLETLNPDEPFIRADSLEKIIWRNYEGALLDEHAISFLLSIKNALEQLNSKGLPTQLAALIQPIDLKKVYEYILNHPNTLLILSSGQSFRLPKELTRLARTLNIVREPSGELMLMLETKRKLASGVKDDKRTIGKGSFGTVKPSWRIDTLVPEEWVNKVMKGSYVPEADYEALFSQHLVESRDDPNKSIINVSMLGELFTSKGIVKRSQYSKRAVGDLLGVIRNPSITLTAKDKERITKNILEGVAVIHAQGKVHQDLKLPNIFIYKDEDGYYAKVADFGISYDPQLPLHKPSLASGGYESPEIMSANESPKALYHRYYYDSAFIKSYSYAYQIHMNTPNRSPDSPEAMEFRKPHPANDMWALGIVLFELEHRNMPRLGFSVDEQRIESNPLFKGMLNPDRNQRIDIRQALELHRIMNQFSQAKPESREPAITFAKPSCSKPEPVIAAKPTMPAINYTSIIGVQYLDLGNIQGEEGRLKRDVFIYTLKKAYDNDPKLFNLILESQTTKDLDRLHQSLIRYLQPPEHKILLYPELINAVDDKTSQKAQAIAVGASDKELSLKGNSDVEQYVKEKQIKTYGHKF